MKYRNFILLPALIFSFTAVSSGGDVNLEADVSWIKPYNKLITGLGGTWRPEFLQRDRLSLGLGMIASVSNRFYYETTPALPVSDPQHSGWTYTNDNHLETMDLDFHLDGRWRVYGVNDRTKWKTWLTLNLGGVINYASISQYQTWYPPLNSADYIIVRGPFDFKSPDRFDPYISPGFLIGIGNFTVGYRQWFYFDDLTVKPGEAARLWGSLRLGYRFQW